VFRILVYASFLAFYGLKVKLDYIVVVAGNGTSIGLRETGV
jgi:hypothetical protein